MIWAAIIILVMLFGATILFGAPYVPSHRRDVERAFTELYKLTAKDVVIDVGSGDGIVLRQAAQKGARAVGYELNPVLVIISWLICRSYGDRVSVKMRDYRLAEFPDDTTVIYAFSTSRHIESLIDHVQSEANRLSRALHLISYGFESQNRTKQKTIGAHSLYEIKPDNKILGVKG